MTRLWWTAIFVALAACAPAPARAPLASGCIPAPAVQTYRGIFRYGFEISTFDGCYLDMYRADDWAAFERRHPDSAETRTNGAAYEYEIAFEGTRETGEGLGPMRAYTCKYVVTRLLNSRRIPFRPGH